MRTIAIITGASAGIGRATAMLLARNDFDVIITGRRSEKLESLEEGDPIKNRSRCTFTEL